MKNLIVGAVVFAVASCVAVAQITSATTPTPGARPTTQPQTSSSQTSDMPGASSQAPTHTAGSKKKSEKSLKGCIQSAGGQFTLEDKHGKQFALTGSPDIAAHVGHTVTVHGSYPNGSPASAAFASSNSGLGSSDRFVVSKLNMVSEKCKATKSKTKDRSIDPNGKPSPNRY